ncbi:MAG: amino acid racemase [Defluviitaleaceae bacterium]|nr:amino acid racemase [Defluviitaleaceae bacterium]
MEKALGILGGMGPLATANFMTQIIESTKAGKDQDHLRIYVDCHSQTPNRVAALLEGGEEPTAAICESIKKLESIGASVLVMPCISAHGFYDKAVESASVPFLNMPDIIVDVCAHNFPGQKAGVLSTKGTADTRILLNPMDRFNIPYITPNEYEQDKVSSLIERVKANGNLVQIAKEFSKVLDTMEARGADYFVLGCTELPVIAKYCKGKHVFLDTTLELAKASIIACGGLVKS